MSERIWTAYLARDERLGDFFLHLPGDWDSAEALRQTRPAYPLDPSALDQLRAAHAAWGVSSHASQRIDRLADPAARVIATGQQAGLLGGPLFTLYKALAAVRWAERLERERRVPVVPVFWVASEDADFDEVRSFRWPDTDGRWQRYEYHASGHRSGMPVHDIPVEPHLATDVADVFGHTRQTAFTAELREQTCALITSSDTLETLFVRTLAWLLGDRTPVFVSPRMAWVRRGAARLLARELAEPGESSRRIVAAGEQLASRGLAPSLHRRPEHVNAFVLRNGLRHKILFRDGAFEIIAPCGTRERIEPARLRAELECDPACFGLNVATRPIVQDALLPTLATVAGPGEIAYFAQLREVYSFFDVPMPVILPRPQLCLIEPRVERALGRLHIALEALALTLGESPAAFDALAQGAVEPWDVEQALRDIRKQMSEAVEFAAAGVDRSDPAVARALERLRDSVALGVDKLAERQRHAAAARDQDLRRAVETARTALWPDGLMQERALTVFFPFLNLFGRSLIERLNEAVAIDQPAIQLIVLSALQSAHP
ncbi:MAG: bacillithiol biosynthesis cysteine-adding enzyme BshC [Candidatus Sumerlaeia bacterium]|nr:bacillithiol biosynthesis cysteine-adding enzyme BshC [Candidatus Sumerlaeia bacterium]